MPAIVIKTFTDSGCFCHLLGCRRTGQALLVDPKLGQHATYLRAAAAFGLTITAVIDTHTHADHLSDSLTFLHEGVPLLLSSASASARPHRPVEDGEVLRVGELHFTALHVPGHTPDSLAIAGHGVVATGDTLLVGGLARADFLGSDPARLFDAVQRQLLTLPGDTVVLPGHGYNDVLFTTIGRERQHNPDLRHAHGAAWARALGTSAGAGQTPAIDATLQFNLAAQPPVADPPGSVATCCAPGAARREAGLAERTCEELAGTREDIVAADRWLDVRDEHEFREEHIPGARNFPLSEMGLHLDELRRRGPVVLQCRSGVRSMTAARTLKYLGVLDQPVNLGGGIVRWKELGLPLEMSRATHKP
jgi:sulfur dioxygenase